MRYADSRCTYTEQYKPEHTYTFTGLCVITKQPYSVTIPGNQLHAYRQGKLIQNAMPSVSAEDREFLMSGISPEGWANTFPDEEDN